MLNVNPYLKMSRCCLDSSAEKKKLFLQSKNDIFKTQKFSVAKPDYKSAYSSNQSYIR